MYNRCKIPVLERHVHQSMNNSYVDHLDKFLLVPVRHAEKPMQNCKTN